MGWYIPVSPVLESWRQEDQELVMAILFYILHLKPAWATCESVSKKKEKKVHMWGSTHILAKASDRYPQDVL